MARPSGYDANVHITAALSEPCLAAGATWSAIAKVCDSTIPTVRLWASENPGFLSAVKLAKAIVDDAVEVAFKLNATGGAVKSTTKDTYGRVMTTYYPPDTTAGIFWLCNRRPKGYDAEHPDAGWQHVQRVEHTGANGGPIEYADLTDKPEAEVIAEAEALTRRAAEAERPGGGTPKARVHKSAHKS